MAWLIGNLKTDGTKRWAQLTADSERALTDAERRLKVKRHGKGHQTPHLDLNRHQYELAKRYDAQQRGG